MMKIIIMPISMMKMLMIAGSCRSLHLESATAGTGCVSSSSLNIITSFHHSYHQNCYHHHHRLQDSKRVPIIFITIVIIKSGWILHRHHHRLCRRHHRHHHHHHHHIDYVRRAPTWWAAPLSWWTGLTQPPGWQVWAKFNNLSIQERHKCTTGEMPMTVLRRGNPDKTILSTYPVKFCHRNTCLFFCLKRTSCPPPW